MKRIFSFGLACALLSLPLIALSHHSQSFFTDVFSELEGELVAVDWRNPHIRFTLKTLNSDGEAELRRIETNSMYYLQRAGVMKEHLQVGDHVKIGGYESKKAGGEFLAAEIVLRDGRHAFLIRDGVTSQFKDVVQDTVAENKGIFRVWSIPQNNQRKLHTPLTDAAKAKQATFDISDNFTTRCEKAGMPRLMWYPHPLEFIDAGNEIKVRLEMYEIVRTIHMDRTAPPDEESYSPLGYSTGRWEGNVLIVNTTHLNWGFYDTRGVPQSNAAQIVERYRLSDDQSRIDYHITTTDPETFTEPATIEGHWLALGESIAEFKCEIY